MLVRGLHGLGNETLLSIAVGLSRNHIADGLIESMDLDQESEKN